MGDLDKTPEQILSEKRIPLITVEVPNVSAPDFSIGWKVKDLVQRYVDSFAKRLKPNLESIITLKEAKEAEAEEDRHCERLQEIYRKFLRAFEEFKDKNGLAVDVGDLTRPFDPEFVRMKQEAQAEEVEAKRQVLIVPVQEEVESSSEEEDETLTEQGVATLKSPLSEVREYVIPDHETFEIEEVVGDQAMPAEAWKEQDSEIQVASDEEPMTEVTDDQFELDQGKPNNLKTNRRRV